MKLSHIDDKGTANMVDVSAKEETLRIAVAEGSVYMKPEVIELIKSGTLVKGDVFAAARIAGIMAAKRTADLIPLCHPLGIDHISIDFEIGEGHVIIKSRVTVTGKTGVEMEALTAVAVAALTIYDMCKSADKGMIIGDIRLMEKSGGRSGHYVREE